MLAFKKEREKRKKRNKMGVIFWIFSYATCYLSIVVLALSIAAGLYLLAEITEEYPTMTCKVLKFMTGTLAALQLLLWMDGLPAIPSIVQLIAFGAYASTLSNFPFIQLLSVPTISSFVLFLVTNGLWLYFLIKSSIDAVSTIGFFLVIVWAIPCGLFISLSVNDNILPGSSHEQRSFNGLDQVPVKSKQKSIFRSSFDVVADYMWLVPGVGTVLNMFRMMSDKKR